MPLLSTRFVARDGGFRRHTLHSRGVTLIETLIAITVATMASTALLLAVQASLNTSTDSVDRTLADGLAQQLVDEIAQNSRMPPPSETSGPLVDRFGRALGTGDETGQLRQINFRLPSDYFGRWRKRVSIFYLDFTTLQRRPGNSTDGYLCIEVTIEQQDATGSFVSLATKRRVIYAR